MHLLFFQLVKKASGFFDKLKKHSILHSAKCEKRLISAVFCATISFEAGFCPLELPRYSIIRKLSLFASSFLTV